MREFITAHYRQFTKFRSISLDTPLYEGGGGTLADRITTGLWD